MWFVRKLKYVKRLLNRLERSYERRFGARKFQRRIEAASVKRIVIGASSKHDPGWIPTEMSYLNLLKPEHWERALVPGSLDAVLAEHVWEHLTLEEAEVAVRTCYTYLKQGGYIRVAVPDGLHPSPEYQSWVRPGGATPGQISNDHKVLYTYRTLASLFKDAGFTVQLYEYFDELGKFQYQDWHTGEGPSVGPSASTPGTPVGALRLPPSSWMLTSRCRRWRQSPSRQHSAAPLQLDAQPRDARPRPSRLQRRQPAGLLPQLEGLPLVLRCVFPAIVGRYHCQLPWFLPRRLAGATQAAIKC